MGGRAGKTGGSREVLSRLLSGLELLAFLAPRMALALSWRVDPARRRVAKVRLLVSIGLRA